MVPPRLLRRWVRLRPDERRLLVRAFVDLVVVDVELRALGFSRLLRRIEAGESAGRRVPPSPDPIRARHYARWIEAAARYHVLRPHCLQRSLVLHRWLRHEGLPSALRIGVLKDGAALKAHAWVELAGQVVNDRSTSVAAFRQLAPFGTPVEWNTRTLAGSSPDATL
jgi:hypothetical protein